MRALTFIILLICCCCCCCCLCVLVFARTNLRTSLQGLPEACCNLGVCYASGLGVAPSAEQAVHWYQVAAEKGLPRAQSNLAGCYASGQFLPCSIFERERETTTREARDESEGER